MACVGGIPCCESVGNSKTLCNCIPEYIKIAMLQCRFQLRPSAPWRKAVSGSNCARGALPKVRMEPTRASFFDKFFSSGGSDDGNDQEQGKFVPLDDGLGTSEEVFGPLAMLAVGYLPEEFERLKAALVELEAEMIKLIPCSRAMLDGTLGEALCSEPGQHEQLPLSTRRVVFLSGMFAGEVMEIISFYRESGLPEPVFAAAVPNNWDRNLGELITDVFEDHQAMKAKQAARQAQQAQAQQQQGPQ